MTLPPLTFDPILKEKVWGGRRLERLGKALAPGANIGESWEIADLASTDPSGGGGGAARSTVASGPLAGRTLADVIAAHGPALLGEAPLTHEGGFPLLIKFLDARENLSVQVHPSEAYARAHPDAHLKHEAWVVIEAEPGAVIYKGLEPGVDADSLAEAVRSGDAASALTALPARPGDVHHLPSGTVHALGAGVLVAEVQTPSDTTFRLFDWGRSGRTLHIDEALACVGGAPPAPPAASLDQAPPGGEPARLIETGAFSLSARRGLATLSLEPRRRAPVVWMVLTGSVRIELDGEDDADMSLAAGDTVLLPATMTPAQAALSSDAVVLDVGLPSAGD